MSELYSLISLETKHSIFKRGGKLPIRFPLLLLFLFPKLLLLLLLPSKGMSEKCFSGWAIQKLRGHCSCHKEGVAPFSSDSDLRGHPCGAGIARMSIDAAPRF